MYNRPTPGDVLSIIQPYEKEIKELIEFVPDRDKCRISHEQFKQRM